MGCPSMIHQSREIACLQRTKDHVHHWLGGVKQGLAVLYDCQVETNTTFQIEFLDRNCPILMTNFRHLVCGFAHHKFNIFAMRCPDREQTIAPFIKCSHRRIFVAHQILKDQLFVPVV